MSKIFSVRSTDQKRILAFILAIALALSLGAMLTPLQADAATTDPYLVIGNYTHYNTFLTPGETTQAALTVVPANSSYIATGFDAYVDATYTEWTSNSNAITIGAPYGADTEVTQGGVTRSAIGATALVSLNLATPPADPIVASISVENPASGNSYTISLTVIIEPADALSPITTSVWLDGSTSYGLPQNFQVTNELFTATPPADDASSILNSARAAAYVAQNYTTPLSALSDIIVTSGAIDATADINGIDFETAVDGGTAYDYISGLSLYTGTGNATYDAVESGSPNYYGWQYAVYDNLGVRDTSANDLGASTYQLKDGYTVWWQYGAYGIYFPNTITPPSAPVA
jgi:hypothetical protein